MPLYLDNNKTLVVLKPYYKLLVLLLDLSILDNIILLTYRAFSLNNLWVTREHLVIGLALFLST